SWRVALLPFVEQLPLYNRFQRKERWDAWPNKDLIGSMRYPYRNPWFQDDTRTGLVMPRGAGTFWGLGGPRPRQDPRHDRSKTILFIEVAEAAAPIWSEPRDIVIDPSNPKKDLGWHWRSSFFRNQKDKCCMAVFADGVVRYVPQRIADEELWFLFSGQ